MSFHETLKAELARIDSAGTTKREELVFEGFSHETGHAPQALIKGKKFSIFNSNDYLGLRFHEALRKGEEEASKAFGSGPGAVRFISGTLKVHYDLEQALAKFHGREAGMIFSSAFATSLAVIQCFIKGQAKDTKVSDQTLVVSDELNHRCIIDGIRVANLPKDNRMVFKHLDLEDFRRILSENKGKFKRAVAVTDGIFSMLGEYQDLKKFQEIAKSFEKDFEEGVVTIVDDSHGIGAFGKTGRGVEEFCHAKCDLLIGTLGKGLGADGGYVVGDKLMIDYLREAAPTYIYSNPVSPGTAGAGLASVHLVESQEGRRLIENLHANIAAFKKKMKEAGFTFAADSLHAVQPILIGESVKCRNFAKALFEEGFIVTNLSYPIVPPGKDEIRVQISAAHTEKDIEEFISVAVKAGKKTGVLG
ncbi:aminotransferase class I/II-fold pyridoxal phosphate-dependent enzyme [Candidatus Woesearchaeota archaeon]|nr:aminotransferase class I/II-fold pyridoxal phosphate-dependent enzyme [Candidatus Woesearchaeota archaeon]